MSAAVEVLAAQAERIAQAIEAWRRHGRLCNRCDSAMGYWVKLHGFKGQFLLCRNCESWFRARVIAGRKEKRDAEGD